MWRSATCAPSALKGAAHPRWSASASAAASAAPGHGPLAVPHQLTATGRLVDDEFSPASNQAVNLVPGLNLVRRSRHGPRVVGSSSIPASAVRTARRTEGERRVVLTPSAPL